MLNDFIEQICDTFRDAICVSDREGKVLLVNRRHAELTGIPREECPAFEGMFLSGDTLAVVFDDCRGTCIDQVFYRGDRLLGGGVIGSCC